MSHERRTTEPDSRLTRLSAVMVDALEADPENDDTTKAIVFLSDEEGGGIVLHGWKDDGEAIAHVLLHLRAIMRANGKDLDWVFVPEDARGLG